MIFMVATAWTLAFVNLSWLIGYYCHVDDGGRGIGSDVDGGVGIYGVELDLLDCFVGLGVCGSFGFDFGGAGVDAVVGLVYVVVEEGGGLVVFCCYSG